VVVVLVVVVVVAAAASSNEVEVYDPEMTLYNFHNSTRAVAGGNAWGSL
jgi:predicted porin